MAQDYIVHGSTPNLYLTHKVAAKETWYSLGRTYGLAAKEIAAYNNGSINTPLEVAQSVKIPLTSANFSQNDNQGESLVPVYHIVGDKEWMYRISVNHNKVPIERLEKWNSVSRDAATSGMKLIVGFLNVREGGASAGKAVTRPEPKQQQSSSASSTATTPATTPNVSKTPTPKGGGYFKDMYEERGTTSSGVAGIFKSTSGWNDGKYYALMNNVVVGTIVKIVYPQTNKTIYAKVLGELPEMKESAGLALRISDAAAGELGAATGKFSVNIKY